ncbi:unnamed protein product [Allacma fusca]|uniref:Uncharacterized protein n=1 Tax=Allacma fusca TaxID=39272 RepID=A0A8J2PY67_9HEXA|nr:unnamed protein product [Allacma fusca]
MVLKNRNPNRYPILISGVVTSAIIALVLASAIFYVVLPMDLSVGSQDDTVSIVNIPFIMVATIAHKILGSTFADFLIDMFVNENEKFVLPDLKVRELIFDGVKLSDLYHTLASFGIADLPEELIDGAFAFYNQRNGTPSKEFKVKSGIKNPKDFGKIVSFDGNKELNWWTNASRPSDEQYCNRINGTDGSFFAPFVSKEEKLEVFSYELCRSIYGIFDHEADFNGIPAYVFATPDRILNISLSNPETDCFCTDPGHGLANSCDAQGFMRMFSCKAGMPVVLSLPHFINGDEKFLKEVEGLHPDKNKHEMTLVVEPNSGVLLQVVKRIQINTEFQRLPGITPFSNITEAFIPVFWVEEIANAPEEDLSYIRHRLVIPLKIIDILKPCVFGIIAVGLLSGIITVLFFKERHEPLL